MWNRSITFKLLSVIAGAFVITTVCILATSNLKLRQIVDISQEAVYREKIDKIIGSFERSNERLEKTGIVEVYKEDFQEAQLKVVAKDHYRNSTPRIYPFIIDLKGNIVLHPFIKDKKNYKDTPLVKTLLSGPRGTFSLEIDGETVWGIFESFKEWNWVVCYVVPLDIKYADVTKFRNTFILLILFITLTVLFFLSTIVAGFVKPVVRLTRISKDIAEGKLDQEVIPKSSDEIGTLAENFELMRKAVKEQILEIKREQKRAENIIEGTNAGTWEMDYKSNVITINERWAEIIGETKESMGPINPENMKNWIHPEDYEKVNEVFNSHIKGEKNFFEIEFRLKHSSGNWVWVHDHGKIVERDNSGNPVIISGTHIDITERKKNEYEITKLRNFLSNIINSMPSIIVGVDPDGIITQWNRTAEINSGIKADKAEGASLFEVYPGMMNELEKIKECIRSREIRKINKRPYQLENGIGYENVTIFPLITNGVEGAVIRIDDVTDNVRMEEMMIQSEKMLSVGGLAAGMAHEINNPLAGMMQTANVVHDRLCDNIKIPVSQRAAEEAGTTTEAVRIFMEKRGIPKMLKTIVDSGSRLADIVDNMLSFARKSESLRSTEKPDRLMDRIVELASTDYDLKEKFDFKSIEIVREYASELPLVPCEGGKIQQVILNILKNGAQAMQECFKSTENYRPKFILRILTEKDKGMLRMEIEDNGPGMGDDVRRRVFEPFFTTKPVGIGTGLGLSVSYFIVTENHGGTMDVESKPGKGAKFIIRLPLEVNESGNNIF